jgi:DNA-binding NarL/FixJ family response regulator
MPEMLRTIIGDLLGQEADLVVVGQSGEGQDTLRSAQDDQADVLIAHNQPHPDSRCLDTILAVTPISILAISEDGRTADAVNLMRRPVALNGGAQSGLADVIRQIAELRGTAGAGRVQRSPA